MNAWSLDRAKITFDDGQVFIGCATYISASDSPDDISEINIIVENGGPYIGAPLSEVIEIVDLN